MRGAGQRQRRKNMARKAGPPPSGLTQFLRVVKNIVSTIVSVGAMIIVLWGILGGHAALAGPWYLHIPLLVFVVTLLAYLEGLQVAILALEHIENKVRAGQGPAFLCSPTNRADCPNTKHKITKTDVEGHAACSNCAQAKHQGEQCAGV